MANLCRSFAPFLLLLTASHAFTALSPSPKLKILPWAVIPPQPYSHVSMRQQQPKSTAATLLYSSSGDEAAAAATKLEKKIAGRKKRVEIGYKIVASAYAIMTGIGLFKYRSAQGLYIAAGPWMASSVAFHLIGSGSNDRLKSGACKRLNLGLAFFGFVGLLAKDIITTAKPLWIFACLVAMVNSIKGYGYGLKGWDLKMMDGNSGAARDIVEGTLSSIAATFELPRGFSGVFSRSAGYAALAVTFGAMKFNNLYKIVSHLLSTGPPNPYVWMPLYFQYKKLLLLTISAFTLKEAVDQKDDWPKGWGGAPVGLGFATSVATGGMAAHYITQGSLYLGGWITFLAIFSAVDGVNRWTSINLPLEVGKRRVK